jgi:hypothetical protein
MVCLNKLWIIFPVVVFADPFHHELTVVIFSSFALAKRYLREGLAFPEKRTPKRSAFLDNELVVLPGISIFA